MGSGRLRENFDKYFSNFEEKIIFFKFEKNKLPFKIFAQINMAKIFLVPNTI